MSGNDISDLVGSVNSELGCLDQWLMSNRLSLNIGKTKFMLTTNRDVTFDLSLTIRGTALKYVEEFEILGITIDYKLSFSKHMELLARNLARSVSAMYRVSVYAPRSVLKNVYFSLVYSRLSYGILAWGGGHLTAWNRIERVHKRATKIMGGRGFCCPLHANSLLSLGQVYKYFLLIKFYKIHILQHHPHFCNRFQSLYVEHSYVTRFKIDGRLYLPFFRKASGHKSFLFNAIDNWNKLPTDIRESQTLSHFKSKLRSLFLRQSCS